MWRLCVLGVLAWSSAGCNQIFGLGETKVVDGAVGGSCSGSATCEGTTVCDTTTDTCVQCTATQAAACTGNTPLCGSDDSCHGCIAHSDCPSDVCLASGACGDATDIAYVTGSGADANPCTQALPCATITHALTTGLPTIKVRGSISHSTDFSSTAVVTVIGDTDAELHADSGATIVVEPGANVTLQELLIASGSDGISVAGGASTTMVDVERCEIELNSHIGIEVSGSGPVLTVAQSRIENNGSGGISITDSSFAIVSNVVFGNGSLSSAIGGMLISKSASTADRLEFNSIANNLTNGAAAGVQCKVVSGFVANSDIVAFNTGLNVGSNTLQVDDENGLGGCAYRYTLTYPTAGPGSGSDDGDEIKDPLFAGSATGDLHIPSDSPAAMSADPTASLAGITAVDADGNPRVAPADRGAFKHTN